VETLDTLHRFIAGLSKRSRKAVPLRFISDLHYQEISQRSCAKTLKQEWLAADVHPSLIPQGLSPLGQCHPRHSRFESKKFCETKPWRNSTIFHSRI
jgi:hypothetical protein